MAFETLITHLTHHLTSHTIPQSGSKKIDVIVGLDARGFILGPIIALRLGAAFVPVRKVGKLPGKCISAQYEKEYGVVRSFFDCLHKNKKGPHVHRTPLRCKKERSRKVIMLS